MRERFAHKIIGSRTRRASRARYERLARKTSAARTARASRARLCQKTLTEAARLATGEESAHERYLKLYRLIQRRDREIAEVFNDPRRSKAYLQIARALHKRIISRAELERFSEETRELVGVLAGVED